MTVLHKVRPFWPFGVLLAAVVFIFRSSLFGDFVFIGDYDRLLTFLDIRLLNTDSIRATGLTAAWDPFTVGGQYLSSLVFYMTELDWPAYIVALFDRSSTYIVSGYFSVLFLFLSGAGAYLFFEILFAQKPISLVCAFLYMFSVCGLQRVGWVDYSLLPLVYAPFAFYWLKRGNGIALVLATAYFWMSSMLQEAAYISFLVLSYGFYLAWTERRVQVGVMTVLSFVIALIPTWPRLLAVREGLGASMRGVGEPIWEASRWYEALRFFGATLFGFSKEESSLLKTPINLHEGLQLGASFFASVVFTVYLVRLWPLARGVQRTAILSLLGMLSLVFSPVLMVVIAPLDLGYYGEGVALFAVFTLIWFFIFKKFFAVSSSRQEGEWVHPEFLFFGSWIAIALGVCLLGLAQRVVGLIFLDMDLLHARISVAALLPFCACVGLYFKDKNLEFRFDSTKKMQLTCLGAGYAFLMWLFSNGWGHVGEFFYGWFSSFMNWNLKDDVGQWVPSVQYALADLKFFKGEVFLSGRAFLMILVSVLFAGAVGFYFKNKNRQMFAYFILLAIAVDCMIFAQTRLMGPVTYDLNKPFLKNNFLNVPKNLMRPPSGDRLSGMTERLGSDRYRTVVLQVRGEIVQNAYYQDHFSRFWRFRDLSGYPVYPWRLSLFISKFSKPGEPWDIDPRKLTMTLGGVDVDQTWRWMGLLNVKQVLIAELPVYYNAFEDFSQLKLVPNPQTVLPRAFWAESVHAISPLQNRFTQPDFWGSDFTKVSYVEGYPQTEKRFVVDGEIEWKFLENLIYLRFPKSTGERFLVLNELPFLRWMAHAGGRLLNIYPTNIAMRGIEVPADVSEIKLSVQRVYSLQVVLVIGILSFVLLFVLRRYLLLR